MVCSAAISRCSQLSLKAHRKTSVSCIYCSAALRANGFSLILRTHFFLHCGIIELSILDILPQAFIWLANLYTMAYGSLLIAKAIWEHTCIAGGLFSLSLQRKKNRRIFASILFYIEIHIMLQQLTYIFSHILWFHYFCEFQS